MNGLLVGLDVGTSASKAVAVTVDGRPIAAGTARTPWIRTKLGAEVDAHALAAAAADAVARTLAQAPEGAVLGLGVASMGESGVLLDSQGVPRTPIIAWHDARDAVEVDELAASFEADAFARHTGLPLRGQWSLTKHRWLITHDPDAKAAVRRLNVAEWVVRAFGGDEAAEQSLASRTGWLDLNARDWWSDPLEWSKADRSLMPELVTAGTPLGVVSREAAIPRLAGAVLTVAGHDHQAATVGAGAIWPHDELDSCGSAEALVRTIPPGLDAAAVSTLAASGITTGWHVLADRWCLLAGTQGGLALQRVLTMLGRSVEDLGELDMGALAADPIGVGIDGVDDAALSISGIVSGVGPSEVWRATLDAVTERAARIHAAMSAVAGPHASLTVTGGWSRSAALIETKRRAFGPLRTPKLTEAGARGAALMAGLAAGVYAGPDEFPPVDAELPRLEARA